MIDIPEGAVIVEACEHGNPMSAACKLCKRLASEMPQETVVQSDPHSEERQELLAIAFGLLASVDSKKAGEDWTASFEEWKARYAALDPIRAAAAG